MTQPLAASELVLDDRMNGFPTGMEPLPVSEVAALGLSPADGRMALPLLSLSLPDFDANVVTVMAHISASGAMIAPHAKTPMSVSLAKRLMAAGAWGATVADARQASVLLQGGVRRLILGNQIGGATSARRLAALLRRHPEAQMQVFVDSTEGVEALTAAWDASLPPLGLLIELGTGRGGLREDAAAEALADAIIALPHDLGLRLAGTAAYEGAVTVLDPEESMSRVDALMDRTAAFHARLRTRLGPDTLLTITAGGSSWIDRVLRRLAPIVATEPTTTLMLRSGAIFFHDNGVYRTSLAAMMHRGGNLGGPVRPAMRLWAEVLSRPERGLAICGLGLRDAAVDQGPPMPLQTWRCGQVIAGADDLSVIKMNDQHAFLDCGAAAIAPNVGDVIEFHLSHPCTNFDRHRLIWILDEEGRIAAALPTAFG